MNDGCFVVSALPHINNPPLIFRRQLGCDQRTVLARTCLLHNDDGPESDLSAFHVLHSLLHFVEGELLDHALHALVLGESDGFFTVKRMSGGPAVNAGALTDHGNSIDRDLTHS